MRCIWYQENGEPFDEKASVEIEKKHVELFKDSFLKSNESSDSSIANELTLDVSVETTTTASQPSANSSTLASPGSSTKSPTKSNKKESVDIQIESLGTLQLENGMLTWYSQEEIYFEKNKSSLLSSFSSFSGLFNQKFNKTKTKSIQIILLNT